MFLGVGGEGMERDGNEVFSDLFKVQRHGQLLMVGFVLYKHTLVPVI